MNRQSLKEKGLQLRPLYFYFCTGTVLGKKKKKKKLVPYAFVIALTGYDLNARKYEYFRLNFREINFFNFFKAQYKKTLLSNIRLGGAVVNQHSTGLKG